MKLFKKSISILCVLTILLSIISIATTANAVSGSNTKIKWSINSKGILTVSRKAKSGTTTISDYSTSNSAPWKKHASSIKSVVVGANITRIGSYAFHGLTKATKITIGKNVTEIGTGSFAHCDSLTKFEVTKSSVSKAFVTSGGILYNAKKTTLVAYPANKSGKSFTCPSSVTTIKGFAFSCNQKLTAFTQDSPGSINAINGSAFNNAKKIETITIKNNATSIGDKAFYNIKTLKKVTIPPSVNSIGSEVFLPSSKVKSLRIYCSNGSKAYDKFSGKGYIISPQDWDFTCNFNANGGDCDEDSKKVIFNKTYGTLPTPEKEGYEFVAWTLDGKEITSSTKVTKAASHTLKAKYKAQTHTIQLDTAGGICNTSSITVTYGQPYGDLPSDVVKNGYVFLGWFTEDDTRIYSNTVFENLDINTLYAHWQKIMSKVTGLNIKYKSKKKVSLSWNNQSNITGYEVYKKNNNGKWSLYKVVKKPKCTISTPNKRYKYSFRVRAYYDNDYDTPSYGQYSSTVKRVSTYVQRPKIKVKYTTLNGGLKKAKLTWRSKGAKKYQVQKFKNGKWKNLSSSTSARSAWFYINSGKKYLYRIRGFKTVLKHKFYSKYKKVTVKK